MCIRYMLASWLGRLALRIVMPALEPQIGDVVRVDRAGVNDPDTYTADLAAEPGYVGEVHEIDEWGDLDLGGEWDLGGGWAAAQNVTVIKPSELKQP